ncbi:MAG: DEAD/DEAH box helicase [Roseivirga sp.]
MALTPQVFRKKTATYLHNIHSQNTLILTSFNDLGIASNIAKALTENNILQPTEIQKKAIPILLQGQQDFIGLAQTGTGKTAAFGLPLLQHIDVQQQHVQALVLAPTRELCQQIAQQLKLFSRHMPRLTLQAVYGGVPIGPQIRALRKPPHLVVATPGRLIDLVQNRAIHLARVSNLVLDEADEMFSMGFQQAIDQILSFVPRDKAFWLFSATMPQEIKRLVNRYMAQDHAQVQVNPENVVNRNIEHQYMVCPATAKQDALQLFLNTDRSKRGVIFCRTKAATEKLAKKLMSTGLQVDALHGDLSQSRRNRVMQAFKNHQLQALVATDVAARGIDVKDLHYVVHYNLPDQLEYYTHRSGRTARAGKKGLSLCIVTPQEVRDVKRLARTLGLQFQQQDIPDRTALDRRRLAVWVEQVMAASPLPQISSELLHMAEEAFAGLSKEELIAQLVAHWVGSKS